MDAADPPRIVFESPAPCADAHHARALLEAALAQARAPSQGWAVTMRVAATRGVLHARGEILDDHGAAVGRRTFERRANDCSGLARAIGVWASLVLDAEVHRPRALATSDGVDGAASAPAAGATEARAASSPARASERAPSAASTPDPADSGAPWSPRDPADDLSPDREALSRRDDGARFEVGAGPFLMGGAGAGLVAGATPFVLVAVARGVFLRPALVFGETLPFSGPDMSLATTRFDGCWRVAGLYTSDNGMQLDLCAGSDLGIVHTKDVVPYFALGPSVDLRGELGSDLAVLLRGLFDVNAVQVRRDSLDTPLWAGRVELAMSWRLQ